MDLFYHKSSSNLKSALCQNIGVQCFDALEVVSRDFDEAGCVLPLHVGHVRNGKVAILNIVDRTRLSLAVEAPGLTEASGIRGRSGSGRDLDIEISLNEENT